jgi:hypothetical protein
MEPLWGHYQAGCGFYPRNPAAKITLPSVDLKKYPATKQVNEGGEDGRGRGRVNVSIDKGEEEEVCSKPKVIRREELFTYDDFPAHLFQVILHTRFSCGLVPAPLSSETRGRSGLLFQPFRKNFILCLGA